VAGVEEQEGGEHRLPAPVWSPVSYDEGRHLALAVLGQRSSTVCAATRSLGSAWDDAMLASWSINPVGMRLVGDAYVFLMSGMGAGRCIMATAIGVAARQSAMVRGLQVLSVAAPGSNLID